MGAAVSLYNRYDELVRRALSNQDGKFVFDSLMPDVYSIRVSLASFVPALRRNIPVLAGSENLLKLQLNSALSSVELVPLSSAEGALVGPGPPIQDSATGALGRSYLGASVQPARRAAAARIKRVNRFMRFAESARHYR